MPSRDVEDATENTRLDWMSAFRLERWVCLAWLRRCWREPASFPDAERGDALCEERREVLETSLAERPLDASRRVVLDACLDLKALLDCLREEARWWCGILAGKCRPSTVALRECRYCFWSDEMVPLEGATVDLEESCWYIRCRKYRRAGSDDGMSWTEGMSSRSGSHQAFLCHRVGEEKKISLKSRLPNFFTLPRLVSSD